MRPLVPLVQRTTIALSAAFALSLSSCAQQPEPSQPAPQSSLAAGTNENDGWVLISPPQRAYAADRTTMMGGPLATSGISENRGAYSVYSLTQADTSAPLSKWLFLEGIFHYQKECEDFKAKELKDVNDPAWITKEAGKKRNRLMYQASSRDFIEGERCVTFRQIKSP